MRIRVFDTETTGLPKDGEPNEHRIIEVGYTDLVSEGDQWFVGATYSQLFNPGRSIDLEALATHHITPDMLRYEPGCDECADFLLGSNVDVYAAHNAAFDMKFIELNKPVICTYKCALWMYDDATRHNNQYLRYYFGLDLDKERCEPAHRAGPDTYVTANNLLHMLKAQPIEQLLTWTIMPTRFYKWTFGMHVGKRLEDPEVPDGYYDWAIKQKDWEPHIGQAIREEYDRRRKESIRLLQEERDAREEEVRRQQLSEAKSADEDIRRAMESTQRLQAP